MKDLLQIAESVQHANFKDKTTVRDLVRRIGKVANKSVNKETEDYIVNVIVNGKQRLDFDTIAKMIDNKK